MKGEYGMTEVLKTIEQPLTEELVQNLVGKFIHVPTNNHKVPDEINGGDQEINVWFGGRVAGYEKAHIEYDYITNEFLQEPMTHYNVLLVDGMGYVLSNVGDVEIHEISKDEYEAMVQEFIASQIVAQQENETIALAQEPKRILLPGDDF